MGLFPFRIVVFVCAWSLLAACGGPSPHAAPKNETGLPAILSEPGGDADAAARLLAGMEGKPDGPYRQLEQSLAWEAHRETMKAMWSKFQALRETGMREFSERELRQRQERDAVLFYPFSGPDALTAVTLFPECREFVMAALEPPGTVPVFETDKLESLDEDLPRFAATLETLLRSSFFITGEMDRQLRGQVTDGVMPLLLVQLVRTGHTVLRYGYVVVNDDGILAPREHDQRRAQFGLNRGVAVEFVKEGGNRPQVLYYLSLNLENHHLAKNSGFPKYVRSLGPVITLLKSTSYMLHLRRFTAIRELLLERSAMIVQDDSGIPFRLFDRSAWDVQLYGDYNQPIQSFRWLHQPDLRAAYQDKEQVKSLGFPVGYGSSRMPSNLQVVRRKD